MPLSHVIEVDAAIALVSLIVSMIGGTVGLVWLAYMVLRHWLRGESYPKRAAGSGERQELGASRGDARGG